MQGRLAEVSGANPEDGVRAFLAEFGKFFGPSELLEQVRGWRTSKDELGWVHVGYQQVYQLAGGGEALWELSLGLL